MDSIDDGRKVMQKSTKNQNGGSKRTTMEKNENRINDRNISMESIWKFLTKYHDREEETKKRRGKKKTRKHNERSIEDGNYGGKIMKNVLKKRIETIRKNQRKNNHKET